MKIRTFLIIVCFLLVLNFPAACEKLTCNYLIVIDTEINVLTVFENNTAIKFYLVATGEIKNGKSLTPSGKFIILSKVREPGWGGGGYAEPIAGGDPKNPLGHYWIGTSAGNKPPGSIGIHGNINRDSIGKSVSHGCVRMHNEEISLLFDLIPIGTEVWIGTSEELSDWGIKI